MNHIRLTYRLFSAGAILGLAAMIIVVAIQIFFRFFTESAPHWTEEAARIFFIYSVAFGTGTAIRRGDFISLNLIQKYLSPRHDKLLQILTDIVVIVFSVIMTIYSLAFTGLGLDERSPALEIPMALVFFSMVIISLSIAIFSLEHLVRLIRGTNTDQL